MDVSASDWVLPDNLKTPDFIICGAMKAGTSTLHYILNQHPDIYIPDGEVHFYDIDNLLEHPEFNYFDGHRWLSQKFDDSPAQFCRWYASHFDDAQDTQLIGEDSTTYISSEIAAKRIRLQKKPVKLIVLLRNPTDRTYSHYWHCVRTGRIGHSFEHALRYEPRPLLERSLYLSQLTTFFKYVPREQMKIVVFEDFLADKRKTIAEVCAFLGVDDALIPAAAIEAHKNESFVPRFCRLQLAQNLFLREAGSYHYDRHLPVAPPPLNLRRARMMRLVNAAQRRLNPMVQRKPPPMEASTKRFLDDYFQRELDGLNELLGRDVMSTWFGHELAEKPSRETGTPRAEACEEPLKIVA